MIELRTFGEFDIRDASGAPIDDLLRQPKRVALFLYLVLAAPAGMQRRDTLLALFWPDLDTQHGRAALRKSLYVLRGALGTGVLITRGDEEVGIDSTTVNCDARAFRTAANAGHHSEALELYRGEWLPGFHAPDASPELGRWLDETRETLRGMAAASAWAAAAGEEEHGSTATAIGLAQRAVRLAPGDEPGNRRLIELLGRSGDRAGALRAYDLLATRLAREYEAEPAPETQAAVAAIRDRTGVAVVPYSESRRAREPLRGAALTPAQGRFSRLLIAAAVLWLASVGTYWLWNRTRPAPDRREGGVAVLEFANLSAASGDEFLGRGLAAETAARLARTAGFRVTAAAAAGRFRAGADDPATIGSALGVAWLVNGSVQRAGDRIRVSVELVRASDGALVWSERFEGGGNDVLAVQDSLSRAVAQAIAPRLRGEELARLATGPTENPQAFLLYLRGIHLLSQRNPTAVAQGIAQFEAAARLDSSFVEALARAGFGYALFIDWEWNYEGVSRDSLFALASGAADQALALDSSNADTWWLRGFLAMHRESGSFAGAREALERALALSPRHAPALHCYGVMEARLGHDSAAQVLLHRALKAEPGRPITLFALSELAYRAHAFGAAQQWLDSALTVEPGFFYGYAFRALARMHTGDSMGARRDAETAIRYSGGDPVPGTAVMVVLEARRNPEAARVLRARLARDVALRGEEARTTSVLWLAMADIAVGRPDAAVRRLRLVTERTAEFWFWLRLPEFDAIRDDPRFRHLVEWSRPRDARPVSSRQRLQRLPQGFHAALDLRRVHRGETELQALPLGPAAAGAAERDDFDVPRRRGFGRALLVDSLRQPARGLQPGLDTRHFEQPS